MQYLVVRDRPTVANQPVMGLLIRVTGSCSVDLAFDLAPKDTHLGIPPPDRLFRLLHSAIPDGGVMAYFTSIFETWRRLATYVDRILKGAKPGDLPVEQAVKFELVVNLKAAKAIGLSISESMLLRADEVIE
jgi:putative tryptophan/tyrosine transport system substrate-binding protein